jgi:transcriptional regulator with GAF, ATPase, and Fis domain
MAPDSPSTHTDLLTSKPESVGPLKVVVIAGPDFGAELEITQGTHRIGKDDKCDLVLHDGSVSRVHLLASLIEGALRISDNHSTNGSYCEGVRFTQIEAAPGTVVRLGRSALKVLPARARAQSLPPSEETRFGGLVGVSLPMRQLFAQLARVAKGNAPLLLRGETGTGKELCAEAVHESSPRAKGPFVVCDLAALPPTLAESELFGHVKGAFTGAQGDRAGAFERADGGTLFLDEVGELPLDLQPRLLRALEKGQVKRVGGNDYRTVDVRVVAATHRDLEEEVRAKRFREDLLYRLAVVKVTLPPLRERTEDIPVLIDQLLERMGHAPDLVTAETRALLRGYAWPGNVRELRNVLERVLNLGADLGVPSALAGGPSPPAPPVSPSAGELAPFKEAKEDLVTAFERDYLVRLMAQCEGNLSRASREAGIDRVYLRKLLKKHGLHVRDADG